MSVTYAMLDIRVQLMCPVGERPVNQYTTSEFTMTITIAGRCN